MRLQRSNKLYRTILMENDMAKRYKTLPPNRRDVALEECFTSAVSPSIAAGDMSICKRPPGGVNLKGRPKPYVLNPEVR